MKKSVFLASFLVLFFTFNISLAQTPSLGWQAIYGTQHPEYNRQTIKTSDGGYLCTGISYNGFPDSYYVLKTDASGAVQWEKFFNAESYDRGESICETTDGGFVVAGYSNSLQSGDKLEPPTAIPFYDTWIIKLDANGNELWQNTIGSGNQDLAYHVVPTNDNGCVVITSTGSNTGGDKTEPTNGSYDMWVYKLNSSGLIVWQNAIGSSAADYAFTGIPTADGGYLLGGKSIGGISADKTEVSYGGDDFWIVKISSLGAVQWDKSYGGTGDESIKNIIQTSDGGYLISGNSNSPISGIKTEANIGLYDYWVVKIDINGNVIWDRTFGGTDEDFLFEGFEDSQGRYFFVGKSKSGTSGNKTQPGYGLYDYWIVNTSSTGIINWDLTVGGSGTDALASIVEDADGGYILCGDSDSPAGDDKTSGQINNSGHPDIWFIKIEPENPVACFTSSLSTVGCGIPVNFDPSCSTHPDINKSIVNWEWDFENDGIYDLTGIPNPAHQFTASGSYVVKLKITDNVGKVDSTTIPITVTDNTNPTANCHTGLILYLDANGNTDLTAIELDDNSTDNCGISNFQIDGDNDGIIDGSSFTFNCANLGTNSPKLIVTDFDNNSHSCLGNITIVDTISPNPAVSNLSLYSAECEATPPNPVSTDNCDPNITGVSSTSFPIATLGITTITWTYTDSQGNTFSQNQDIEVLPLDTSIQLNGITLSAVSGYSYQWLNCSQNWSEIPGETSQNYTPSSNGDYAVEITLGTCVDTSSCSTVAQVSLNSESVIRASLYPNPAFDHISIIGLDSQQEFTILNTQGKILAQDFLTPTFEINIENLAKGPYFIKLENGLTFKFVKQ